MFLIDIIINSIAFANNSMPGRLGKYEILKTLGSGGSCKVKLAIDTTTGEKVAIKMLNQFLDAKTHSLIMNEV